MKFINKIFSLKIVALLLTLSFSSLLFAQRSNQQGAVALYKQGLDKQNRDDYYGAVEDFQQALQVNPSYGDAWFHLSQVTYAIGDYSLALTYLDSAEKYAKNRSEILNLRGMIYISLGKLQEARKVFNDILKTYPNDIDARFGLAELDLYDGSVIGAQKLYLDALKRQTNNRKALLALALLSAEQGKDAATKKYIDQALRYHSGEAEVHYLAAYLEAKQGNLAEAERRARSAVQIESDFTNAYVLLATILYSQDRFDDVIDICDFLISKKRKTGEAWYLKGLSQYKKGEMENSISTWTTALTITPDDEIMRDALELVVIGNLPIEDSRRPTWAKYHIKKARDYAKTYMGEEARYEYQRALKLNPNDTVVRAEFAELLARSGLHEIYLNQMKFIQNQQKENEKSDSKKKSYAQTRAEDIIESYESLMKYSLSAKWNVDPFYLDKIRWHIGFYYTKNTSQFLHPEAEEVVTGMAADIFSGIATTSIAVQNSPVKNYGEAYRLARQNKMDYFALMEVEESEREVSLDVVVYSGRTGTETTRFNYFRTGNDRLASILRAFRRDLLGILPVRGKIIDRSVNELLIDLGKVEGMKEGVVLDVVKLGQIQTEDKGPGVRFNSKDYLGKITVSKVGEEICQGVFEQSGFYDRVNVGDEVLVRSMPATTNADAVVLSDTAPVAGENGDRILPEDGNAKKRLNAEELGLVKTPAIIDMIRAIR